MAVMIRLITKKLKAKIQAHVQPDLMSNPSETCMEKAKQIHLNCHFLPLAYCHSHFLVTTINFRSIHNILEAAAFLQLD